MFSLDESLTIYNVVDVKERFFAYLQEEGNNQFYIDASKVEDMDGVGLQLLLSIMKTCTNAGVMITIKISRTVKELLQLTGSLQMIENAMEGVYIDE